MPSASMEKAKRDLDPFKISREALERPLLIIIGRCPRIEGIGQWFNSRVCHSFDECVKELNRSQTVSKYVVLSEALEDLDGKLDFLVHEETVRIIFIITTQKNCGTHPSPKVLRTSEHYLVYDLIFTIESKNALEPLQISNIILKTPEFEPVDILLIPLNTEDANLNQTLTILHEKIQEKLGLYRFNIATIDHFTGYDELNRCGGAKDLQHFHWSLFRAMMRFPASVRLYVCGNKSRTPVELHEVLLLSERWSDYLGNNNNSKSTFAFIKNVAIHQTCSLNLELDPELKIRLDRPIAVDDNELISRLANFLQNFDYLNNFGNNSSWRELYYLEARNLKHAHAFSSEGHLIQETRSLPRIESGNNLNQLIQI